MNCPAIDKLEKYVDDVLTEQEHRELHTHINNCGNCKHVVNSLKLEQQFLKETLSTPTLPDNFASQVLEQLEPFEQKVRNKRTPWRQIMLFAASLVLVVGVSTTLNEGFAQWIGGLFSTSQVDEGLRMATDAGLSERVNIEAKDQGITLKVEDVITDSSRVALSYQVLNDKGKPQDTQLDFADSNNQVYATNQKGERLDLATSIGWQDKSDYGLIEFSMDEHVTNEDFFIKLDVVDLLGKEGNWVLEVPVKISENRKLTTTIPLDDANTSLHGVTVTMKEFRSAPSSNEIVYETALTNDEQATVEEEIQNLENKYGEELINSYSYSNYGAILQYHMEDDNRNVVYRNDMLITDELDDNGGFLQGSGEDLEKIGHTAWNDMFVPKKNDSKLTFVLNGVLKREISDFSIQFKPEDLKKKPVSFEYEGNFMTIKKAKKQSEFSLRKSIVPIKRESLFKIEIEGGKEPLSTEFGAWVLEDEKGNIYDTNSSGSVLNEKDENGRKKTTIDLTVLEMDEMPEELTLHLLSVTRYYKLQEPWKVPLFE
ncbi:DUF4179 domain-containing protein [Paenisporosarcina indica]|uniref:DUF4179 domain-containing protein n=1 Tax=Paenisporosarcina indica TaxID=650093 RepID=UPI00095011F4|nr:DUF4179 domain-containing protein [Paenisporosarcina indica]